MNSSELFYESEEDKNLCNFVFTNNAINNNLILGSPFLEGLVSVYDYDNQQIDFYTKFDIKGNKIIVNDDGHVVKEELYTWSETYGHIVYYNIKVNNGEYNFRICVNPSKGYQFFQAERSWSNKGMHYFYNTKNKTDEYVLGEFSY